MNEGLIRTTVPPQTDGTTNREWMSKFLDDIGHPEMAFPAVHVAGTSGKGSVALLIAESLRASGFKTGLHTSPYLQVATEKLAVDGKYASAEEFVELVRWIRPLAEKWRRPNVPIHGMASVAICLEYFRRKKVDIAVIEAGVGGKDDFTNVLKTRLAVITPIGLDHTKILGATVDEIAVHKAGIIKHGVPVVAYKGNGYKVIEAAAKRNNAPLTLVETSDNFVEVNKMLAYKASLILTGHSRTGKEVTLPGRMETVQTNPTVILDGAHNLQKLSALFHTLPSDRYIIVFGMLKGRFDPATAEILKGRYKRIILTAPRVYGKEALDPEELAAQLHINDPIIETDPLSALKTALSLARTDDTVLVTGSLYLVGNIRNCYYPPEDIVQARTSWPRLNT